MRINKINLNNSLTKKALLKKQSPCFSGGYKDIFNNREKKAFDEQMKFYINKIKHSSLFGIHKTKKVDINGEPAKLRIYKGKKYILSSDDKKIEAVMILSDSKSKDREGHALYEDVEEKALFMDLLYSKGNGAGSFLVNEAVKKAEGEKYNGKVIVYAGTLNDIAGSPIPFYYNLGFKTYIASKQKFLEQSMKKYNKTGVYRGYDNLYMYIKNSRNS